MPRHPEMEVARTERISVRVTPDEYVMFDNLASPKSLSDYVRDLLNAEVDRLIEEDDRA